MLVLVTGANGLLGANTVAVLAGMGIPVRGFLRDAKRYPLVPMPGVKLVEGDITNADSVLQAMQGCTHVIHTAALTRQDEFAEAYYRVNVEGTRYVAEAARQCGVQRVVWVSTANTMGFGTKQQPGHEANAMNDVFLQSPYAYSKWLAEQWVIRYAADLDYVIVNPTFMLGPYDVQPGSGKIIQMVRNKRIVWYPPGGKNFVHVQDVAHALVAAMQRGVRGERYLASNENLTYREFFAKVARHSTARYQLVPAPGWLIQLAGKVGDQLRSFGIRSVLSSANAQILCVRNFYTNAKSIQDLNLSYRSIDYAIHDAVAWWKEQELGFR
ncbi:MAG: NAD-dependent epimerase/dehydratase family protein [Bacteroidetes bacterium CHB5]|nr:NAD-dependent epimerase/dehydratase family protein [Bacteroidetes bacterium CHB5]